MMNKTGLNNLLQISSTNQEHKQCKNIARLKIVKIFL
jgi:hypothetical protein